MGDEIEVMARLNRMRADLMTAMQHANTALTIIEGAIRRAQPEQTAWHQTDIHEQILAATDQ